jgi:hypothetical protein
MARIRTIKPEFPQTESMGRVSRDARLLFVMLFTIVDDEGRARAAPRMLASLLFPYDDDAKARVAEWLAELEQENCVELYEVDGNAYLRIASWLAHQRIDKPSRSRLPPPPARADELSQNAREASAPEGNGVEGRGEEGNGPDSSDVPSDPCDRDFQIFWKEYPTDAVMSKKRALEQWDGLSQAEREAARQAIPAFKDYCRKHPTYRPVHAERFLSQRRFEGFALSATAALSATEIEANKDRADRLMRRGKYAVSYQ